MKKINILVIILLSLIFIPTVKAENFTKFTARSNFSNNINVSAIQSVVALISVPGEEDFREIELTNTNLFNYETTDMPTNAEFDSAYVKGDRGGDFTITGRLNKSGSTATLEIMVSVYTTTTTTTTTKVQTSKVVGDDDIIIIDDNGNVNTTEGTNPYETVVIISTSASISEAAQNRKAIYRIVLLAVGLLLAVVIFMIIVKAIRTSNLM